MIPRKTSLALLVATTLVVAACSNNDNYDPDPTPTPPMANQAPTISAIGNKTESQDITIGPFDFGIEDLETPEAQLTVTAIADSNTLFPPDRVVLGGSGALRTLTLTPLEDRTGTATITVTVADAAGLSATRAFNVTVAARNASVREAVVATFAKGNTAEPTPLNGFTFTQDADDPAVFEALVNAP
jgi:hypothetical protein